MMYGEIKAIRHHLYTTTRYAITHHYHFKICITVDCFFDSWTYHWLILAQPYLGKHLESEPEHHGKRDYAQSFEPYNNSVLI